MIFRLETINVGNRDKNFGKKEKKIGVVLALDTDDNNTLNSILKSTFKQKSSSM